MDPRIGVLNSGKFYAFVHGYDKPETMGTLEQVETALGLRAAAPATAPVVIKRARRTAPLRSFEASLTDPSGYVEHYRVEAETKAKARKKIADLYRESTPPKSAGFYTFAQMKFVWIEIEE